MKKLRVGVIGLGMGSAHISGYRTHADAEVVAVADSDPKRLEEKGGKELKVPALYTSAEEMLKKENLDVVSIVTPNKFHKPLTIAAFKAGCRDQGAGHHRDARYDFTPSRGTGAQS